MELYTTEQVAIKLQVHPETVRRLIRRNDIGFSKIGNRYRISQDQMDEYLNS